MSDLTKIVLVIVFASLIIIVGPLAAIWALNTLFPALAIPYTLETWLAAFLIQAVFKSEVSFKK
jgi:hypothetical protein